MLSWTHSQTLYRTTSRPFFTSFQSHFSSSSSNTEDYPTGDFNFEPLIGYNKFLVRLNMKFALPSKRVKDGAYDPCISAVYLHIDHLSWGWAKLDEIQRQILNFRKSGKMVVAYVPSIQPTEYYLACACDEIFTHTALQDHIICSNWLEKDSYLRGKRREEVENFINEGVYQVDKLKNEGFISSLVHDDHEVINLLKKRLGGVKSLPMISFEKYSKVRKWTVGISEAKEQIAIIRVSGTMGTDIVTSKFIEKIGMVKASKEIKAVIIRIDSTGGDVRDSQLMWKEISAGYYMATGAGDIVAENLSLTTSIGGASKNFIAANLWENIDSEVVVIKRGRKYLDKLAITLDKVDKDKMKEIPHRRIWIGKDAASQGLVDAIGGISRAIAIAKFKANIPQNKQVNLVELSRSGPSLRILLRGIGYALVGDPRLLNQLLEDNDGTIPAYMKNDTSLSEVEEDTSFNYTDDGLHSLLCNNASCIYIGTTIMLLPHFTYWNHTCIIQSPDQHLLEMQLQMKIDLCNCGSLILPDSLTSYQNS
ncbi:hypothetical protein MTR_5g025810 [Medicago truncatula]|uniref:Uncharacterized protein n=1 Tax=Medicago truncatula TaxID=3880 RepID=G7K434_MEDTR|nr:hypothetical protein MTR_5g025810 [Medicago truncatula]